MFLSLLSLSAAVVFPKAVNSPWPELDLIDITTGKHDLIFGYHHDTAPITVGQEAVLQCNAFIWADEPNSFTVKGARKVNNEWQYGQEIENPHLLLTKIGSDFGWENKHVYYKVTAKKATNIHIFRLANSMNIAVNGIQVPTSITLDSHGTFDKTIEYSFTPEKLLYSGIISPMYGVREIKPTLTGEKTAIQITAQTGTETNIVDQKFNAANLQTSYTIGDFIVGVFNPDFSGTGSLNVKATAPTVAKPAGFPEIALELPNKDGVYTEATIGTDYFATTENPPQPETDKTNTPENPSKSETDKTNTSENPSKPEEESQSQTSSDKSGLDKTTTIIISVVVVVVVIIIVVIVSVCIWKKKSQNKIGNERSASSSTSEEEPVANEDNQNANEEVSQKSNEEEN